VLDQGVAWHCDQENSWIGSGIKNLPVWSDPGWPVLVTLIFGFTGLTCHGIKPCCTRCPGVGSLTLRECEQRLKVLKRLLIKDKAFHFNHFVRGTDVHTELTKALDALGIQRALVYHGIHTGETYQPVGMAIQRISDHMDQRLKQMEQRQAA
jgi:hypothetical protein